MSSINLSERQVQLLRAVLEVAKTDIDFAKVAEIADFKTTKYARDQWTILRNKLIGYTTKSKAINKSKGGSEDASEETSTLDGEGRKKGTQRKRKSDAGNEGTPTNKKGKKGKAESATPSKAESDDEIEVKAEPNQAGEAMDELL